MSIQLAAYRGISKESKAIKLITYSIYSHNAAHFTEDMDVTVNGVIHHIAAGNVIEAWSPCVRLTESLSAQHTPGTIVDLFDFKIPLTKDEERIAAEFLMYHVLNKTKYAWWLVGRFLPLVRILFPKPPDNAYILNHLFCSELLMLAFAKAGRPILERCKAWEIPPRDLPRSPLLKPTRTVRTS